MLTLTSPRRPTTTNSADFWYINLTNWQQLLEEYNNAPNKKATLNSIRKYDHAGRIMETDEGMSALSPCKWCRDRSLECRVFATREDKACAYCKRMSKGGCTAKVVPDDDEDGGVSLATVVADQQACNCRVDELETECRALETQVEALWTELEGMKALVSEISNVFGRFGRQFATSAVLSGDCTDNV